MAFMIRPPQNWGNLEGIPTDLTDGKISWDEVINKPSSFTPSTHIHNEYLPVSGGQFENFTLWDTKFYRWDGINNNYKNIGSIAGLSNSYGTLLEAPAFGNFALGIRPNQTNDGFALIFTDISTDPANINYSIVKLRIVRGEIYLDAIRLVLANLPTTAAGLATGTVWRDTNGFLRIV